MWKQSGRRQAAEQNAYSGGSLQLGSFFGGGLGQGPGALAWLTGNFTNSGFTAIAQPWAS